MTKRTVVLIIILISAILYGCSVPLDLEYSYRQSADQITSIEILRKEYDSVRTDTPMNVLKVFDPSEFQMVLDGLGNVPITRRLNPPGTGFGLYIIRITYQNGEADLIGNYNTGYITTDGQLYQESYFFHTEPYYDLISALLGEEITDYTYG